ncbi:MAG: sulfotransferase [Rubrobacter sp.]
MDQEKLAEKNRRLKSLRKRLEEKDRELAESQAKLAQARSAAYMQDLSYESAPVFFVIGRAKSGTSWLMRLLNAHPEILCRGEGRFFGRDFIREDFRDQERIQPSSLYRAFLEAEYLQAWMERSVWTRGDDVEGHLINLTRMATHYFLTQRLTNSGKRIVGDKTPLVSADIVSEMSAIYPEAKVIHIIRDGRDIAISMVHHRWNRSRDEGGIYELDPEEARRREAYRKSPEGTIKTGEGLFTEKMIRSMANGWRKQINETRQGGMALLGANYAEVRYEDLLEHPETEAERLLEFLGADAGEEAVRECVRAASFENWTDGRERGQEDPSSFFRKGVAGDWENVFTEQDKRIFKEEAGDLLLKLGYEKDSDW